MDSQIDGRAIPVMWPIRMVPR